MDASDWRERRCVDEARERRSPFSWRRPNNCPFQLSRMCRLHRPDQTLNGDVGTISLPEVVVRPGEDPAADFTPVAPPADVSTFSYPDLSQQQYEGLSSALRSTRSVFDDPRATSIIDSQQLTERQPRTVIEALEREVGVLIQRTGSGQASPFIRGLTGPHPAERRAGGGAPRPGPRCPADVLPHEHRRLAADAGQVGDGRSARRHGPAAGPVRSVERVSLATHAGHRSLELPRLSC